MISRRPRVALLLALAALALPVVLAACGSSEAQQRGPQGPQPFPVLEVGRRSITLTSDYPATLEGEQTVEIRPRTEGYITRMNVDEGDAVRRGQLLFQLNNEDEQQAVRSARADVEAAQANVQTARDEVERIQALVEQDIISEYELRAARNTLQERQAALNQRQAALTNAQVDLGYTSVRSPTDGVIGEIPYRIGSLVSSSIEQPLTVVSDVSEVYAYFSMGEGELLEMNQATGSGPLGGEGPAGEWQAAEGQREVQVLRRRVEQLPRVQLVLTDGSVYAYEGDVKLASGLIDTRTGSASFRATFDNPNRILRSGATANVRFPFQRPDAIVIPKSATYDVQDQRFVYRVDGRGDTTVVRGAPIQTASLSTDKLYVVESGLSASDRIVTEGIGTLSDSTAIVPQLVDADSLFQALTARNQRTRTIVDAGGGANSSGPPDFGRASGGAGNASNEGDDGNIDNSGD